MNKKIIIIIAAVLTIAAAAVVLITSLGGKNETPDAPKTEAEAGDMSASDTVGGSEVPTTPEIPENNESTDKPQDPDTPVSSDTPDAPNEPVTPVAPDAPVVTPVEPDIPTEPETPEVPDVPTEPETPEVPAEPTEPHTHSYVAKVVREANCGQMGKVTYTCDCGSSYSETTDREPDDHDFDEGKLNGVMMIYTCKRCTKTKKVNVCQHIWTDWKVICEGSCVDGYSRRVCENCYLEEKQTILAVGHCVYGVIGEGKTTRTSWCIGCYTIKTEEFPDGNPNYVPGTTVPSTPSNIPGTRYW